MKSEAQLVKCALPTSIASTSEPTIEHPFEVTLHERAWGPAQAEETYFVRQWSDGYFFVNESGHVAVRPVWGSELAIDVYAVARQLHASGTQFPLLLRFQDLLQARVIRLNESFRSAIEQFGYQNSYRGVYPIKVNQLREVVEEILEAGRAFQFGLECGSKAELVAALAYVADDMLLICNGCKDALMMRLILEGQQIDRNILPVIERFDEYEQFVSLLREVETKGQFGVRVRLSTSGAGLWSESGGEGSKFGLSVTELMRLLDDLERREQVPRFRLLHFHLGSQIAYLQNVRQAVCEATRIYASLRKRGVGIEYLDVGGGLGVSYEAGNPEVPGHINYGLEDYAATVVEEIGRVCDEEGVPHPVIVSESGRAVTAFHSVLVVEVLDTRSKIAPDGELNFNELSAPVRELASRSEMLGRQALSGQSELVQEFELAEAHRADAVASFREGSISMEEKALADRLYWRVLDLLNAQLEQVGRDFLPEKLQSLAGRLADQYLCNFSVFRSVVDHWAIGQRFPIMPLHRLDEPPLRQGILVDLTCDSDGKVSDFVAPRGDKRFLELHEVRPNEPYLIGFFLMGAYQDIMGDMHNLFGRVTEAHVYADPDEPENFFIEKVLDGATIEEQLALVQYFPNDLERRMNDLLLDKVRKTAVRPREGALLLEQYRRSFREYTYLNTDPASGRKRPIRGSSIRRPLVDPDEQP